MQRRICHKEQKGKKGASGYALRTLLAGLKSGQFICSKSGQFYLLTTACARPVKINVYFWVYSVLWMFFT